MAMKTTIVRSWMMALAAGTALGLGAPDAGAQDALGSGRVLDANQRAGSGGVNTPVSDFYADLALRNAIVTGNAPGGQSFRAEVGYRASGDFLGTTADDVIFNFQRDSYFSGLAARDVRGITALQLQMNVAVSGQTGAQGLIISRPGAGVSADLLQPGSRVEHVDPYGTLQGALRSTSSHFIRQADRPNIVGQRDYGDGNVMPLTASSLFGVRPLSFDNPALSGPLDVTRAGSAFDPLQQLPEDQMAPGAPGSTKEKPERTPSGAVESAHPVSQSEHLKLLESLRATTTRLDLRLESPADDQRADQPIEAGDRDEDDDEPTSPDATNPSREGEDTSATRDPLDDALRRLTGALSPGRTDTVEGLRGTSTKGVTKEPAEAVVPEFDPLSPEGRRGDAPRPGQQNDEEAREPDTRQGEGPAAALATKGFDPSLTMLVDAMAQEEFTLRTFGGEEAAQTDLYSTHMRTGEKMLREGRFMDAEERFAVALTLRQGDAMAALGRVQAQIGAGLIRSAASNLRDLLRAYPELATTSLDPGIMPPGPRLDRIAAQLEQQRGRRSAGWIDAAFLSAYVAHLLNDRIGMVQAFDDLERAEKASNTFDPVHAFVERVWMTAANRPADEAPAPPTEGAGEATDSQE